MDAKNPPAGPTDHTFLLLGMVVLILLAVAGLTGYWLERDAVREHKPFADAKLDKDVVYVTGRTWPLVERVSGRPHLRLLRQTATGVELKADFGQLLSPSSDVTILIHGYQAPAMAIVTYFSGVVEALKTKGYAGTVVVYDWPSTATRYDMQRRYREMPIGDGPIRGGLAEMLRTREAGWELTVYSADRENARQEGAPGLLSLLSMIRDHVRPARINIIAHSMGSYLLMESMRANPDLMQGLGHIVLVGPDLPVTALEEPGAKQVVAAAASVHVYYSRNDSILGYSELASGQKSMGREGPAKASATAKLHAHDLTDKLGKDQVHGKYLDPAIAIEILAETILAP